MVYGVIANNAQIVNDFFIKDFPFKTEGACKKTPLSGRSLGSARSLAEPND